MGGEAVESNVEKLKATYKIGPPKYINIDSIHFPATALGEQVFLYAQKELDHALFNHAMRVYFFGGLLRKNYFHDWKVDKEKYFITCLLHNIDLGSSYQLNTSMSFEMYGAFLAHNFILENSEDKVVGYDVAEDVSEAIIRHTTDLEGRISPLGKLIQLTTSLDVSGDNSELYHRDSVNEILERFPNDGFANTFASLMDAEITHKPGCHTTTRGHNFTERIRKTNLVNIYSLDKQ